MIESFKHSAITCSRFTGLAEPGKLSTECGSHQGEEDEESREPQGGGHLTTPHLPEPVPGRVG
jgi:hypothetical protein